MTTNHRNQNTNKQRERNSIYFRRS